MYISFEKRTVAWIVLPPLITRKSRRYESEGVYQDLVGGSAVAIAFLTGMSNFTAAIGPLIVLHSVYDNGAVNNLSY